MLSIKDNLMATDAARYLSQSYNSLSNAVAQLSSGLRINSAKDDAAGMAVSTLINADISQENQASRNAQDGVSMLQAAEGAMGVMDNILVQMKQLAEQASTGSYSTSQRSIMNDEYNQLASEITQIATSTTFNGISLLDGSKDATGGVNFDVGGSGITFQTQNMTAAKIAGGQSITSTSATAQVLQSNTYVASASDTYIQGAATNSADKSKIATGTGASTITMTVDTKTVSVDLSAYAGVGNGISLNDLVQQINAAATTAGISSPIASAAYDSTYKGYRLQLTDPTAGVANTIAFTAGGANLTGFDNTNDFAQITAASNAGANDLTTTAGAAAALATVTTAITTEDTYRAQFGNYMNRLNDATQVLGIQSENLTAAESSISDVDVATEMAQMTNAKVLAQAGVSMLAQANSMPEMALKLLQG